MWPWLKELALAAAHDVPVLLTGESGTGKTHVARLIHDSSSRKGRRFLVVPCGALAPGLIESELFGHARGAFTGAGTAREGKFYAAGTGSLLLDEVDALGLEQQARLLRVLETGAFEPVGSTRTQRCQARIMAASNVDLEEAVRRGRFRADLYYRLDVLSVHLPPLRERVQDIGPLARAAVTRLAARFGKAVRGIGPEALACLKAFRWPGNIRQLENVMQQAVLVSAGPEIQPEDLPPSVRSGLPSEKQSEDQPVKAAVDQEETEERAGLEGVLQESGPMHARAAAVLEISRATWRCRR